MSISIRYLYNVDTLVGLRHILLSSDDMNHMPARPSQVSCAELPGQNNRDSLQALVEVLLSVVEGSQGDVEAPQADLASYRAQSEHEVADASRWADFPGPHTGSAVYGTQVTQIVGSKKLRVVLRSVAGKVAAGVPRAISKVQKCCFDGYKTDQVGILVLLCSEEDNVVDEDKDLADLGLVGVAGGRDCHCMAGLEGATMTCLRLDV